MATGMYTSEPLSPSETVRPKVGRGEVLLAFLAFLAMVALTRWPLRRLEPLEYDEFHFLNTIRDHRFPMHHTLFLSLGRILGEAVGDLYAGFVVLSIGMSALALTCTWWWLRAVVRPGIAVAACFTLSVGPVFWGYGAMAANYTSIIVVGSFLLGIAARAWRSSPRPWYPYASAIVLGLGTGYREDIGIFWLPVFVAILWKYRWSTALWSVALFAAVNFGWIGLMLYDIGGWTRYQQATHTFGKNAGFFNSVWTLGVIDAPLRYGLKAAMALIWTLGAGLLFIPRGARRLLENPEGRLLTGIAMLSIFPALGIHLLVHFGVAGYAFHYVPFAIALIAIGIGRTPVLGRPVAADRAGIRLLALSMSLATVFLLYPTDYTTPGFRGDFDLAFARFTRVALRNAPTGGRTPNAWRTANSISVREAQTPANAPGGGIRGN